MVFINPTNIVQILNGYVSNIPPTKEILDEEKDIAKKFIQKLIKEEFIEDRIKSKLNVLASTSQS
jgi:hypothetical protein